MQSARPVQIVFADESSKGTTQGNADSTRRKTSLSAKRIVIRGKKTPKNDEVPENSQFATIFSQFNSETPRPESVTSLTQKNKAVMVKTTRKMFYSQSIHKIGALSEATSPRAQGNHTPVKATPLKDIKLKFPQADTHRISMTPHGNIPNLLNHEIERKNISTPDSGNNLLISSVRIKTTTVTRRAPPKKIDTTPKTSNKFRITTRNVEIKQALLVKSPCVQISKACEEKASTEIVESQLIEDPPVLQPAEIELAKEYDGLYLAGKNDAKTGDCDSEFAEDTTASTNSRSHPADDLNSAENIKSDLNSSMDTNIELKPWRQTTKVLFPKRPQPKVSAECWVLYDTKNDEIISSKNPNQVREIASLTKIMTTVLALEFAERNKINLEEYIVRVSSLAPLMMGTTARLREGDCLSLLDLLHGVMLPSGNDAAVAVAESLGKCMLDELRAKNEQNPDAQIKLPKTPIWCFINQMNQRAKELGMNDTRFLNPHGLTYKENTSTASDIAKLSAFAMKNPQFRLIVKKKFYLCYVTQQNRVKRQVSWENTNKLLHHGYDGLKTGNTPSAGPCLATSLQRGENKHLICVVLNCSTQEQRFGDSRKLMEYGMRLLVHQN